jgi:hypothetical protein
MPILSIFVGDGSTATICRQELKKLPSDRKPAAVVFLQSFLIKEHKPSEFDL